MVNPKPFYLGRWFVWNVFCVDALCLFECLVFAISTAMWQWVCAGAEIVMLMMQSYGKSDGDDGDNMSPKVRRGWHLVRQNSMET